ncbi:MAG: putative deoxyhypusine synthase [Methanoregulaceae archaeon PtaU1.Bin222]|jgi:deoxyhypusine synthase|nr:MAG: putative deoxyhypusine synthase [Methanoregulaceae archaeon PtaU1.Bin222]
MAERKRKGLRRKGEFEAILGPAAEVFHPHGMCTTQPVIPTGNVDELLQRMSKTGFQGRKLGESVEIWKRMIRDPDVTILFGLSGAMIPAGMQKVLIEMARRHYIDVVVSTGANIFHDVCEHLGVCHYLGHHHVSDADLYKRGIDRIYDVFAFEEEFRWVDRGFANYAERIAPFRGSSREFLAGFGEWLAGAVPAGESFLSTCVKERIPVFVPALCDSSIGIGALIARRRGVSIDIDQIADTDEVTSIVEEVKKTGVVYLGGGVPKNFIQQTQVIGSIHKKDLGGHDYAIQYTTDSPHWGGLSGCTFDEAISWGKESEHTMQVQVHVDATIALPIVVSALIESGVTRVKKRGLKKKKVVRQGID